MKKFLSVLLALTIIVCAGTFYVYSAESDFQIEKGVLTAYTGTDAYVSVPKEVYYIGDGAFADNPYVQTVMLHENVYYIGNKAFYNCADLQAVLRSTGVTSAGAFAFEGTPFIENKSSDFITLNGILLRYQGKDASVTVPKDISSLAPYAFYGNTDIQSVAFEGDTSEIGEGAFYGCSSLVNADIPKSVTTIGAYAFYDTPWLNGQWGQVISEGGILIAYNGGEEAVSVSSQVKKIAPCAFVNNSSLKSVTVPSGVYLIGKQAFFGCENLTYASLSEGNVFIDEEAFANCPSLKSCRIPRSTEHIGKGAFAGCSSIDSVIIGGNIKKIDYGAFAGCAGLESVYFRDNSSNVYCTVESNAFYGCASLNGVRLSRETANIAPDAFNNCSAVVYASDASYAREYCALNKVEYSKELGDVNGDGDINIKDAADIQLYLAQLTGFTQEQVKNADADYNGTVNIQDASFIQLVTAQLI